MIFQRLHNKRALYLDQQLFSQEIEALQDHDWSEPLLENWVTCILENTDTRIGNRSGKDGPQCCEYVHPACKLTVWH